jgi:hypothetical protein
MHILTFLEIFKKCPSFLENLKLNVPETVTDFYGN